MVNFAWMLGVFLGWNINCFPAWPFNIIASLTVHRRVLPRLFNFHIWLSLKSASKWDLGTYSFPIRHLRLLLRIFKVLIWIRWLIYKSGLTPWNIQWLLGRLGSPEWILILCRSMLCIIILLIIIRTFILVLLILFVRRHLAILTIHYFYFNI